MTTTTKHILSAVAALVIVLAIAGAYQYPSSTAVTTVVGSVGDTQATPKMAQVQCDNTGATYISADNKYQLCTLTNTDSRDRIINSVEYAFDNLGTVSTSSKSSFLVVAATSTSAAAGIPTSPNYIINQGIATTTPFMFVSSSTPGSVTSAGTKDFARVWAAGTVLVVESVATTSSNMWFKVTYVGE